MRSLIDEALSRGTSPNPQQAPPVYAAQDQSYVQPQPQQPSAIDDELSRFLDQLKTNIKIVGCGGGGTNTIGRIVEEGITGAELYAANTDAQHLLAIDAPNKILLGRRCTRGLGAGALPRVGEEAAAEADDELRRSLMDAHIVFVTAGMGGGTGTGSAPYVAKLAKNMGALTIAVTTMPFEGEGRMRMENAIWGLDRLRESADTVIVIPNDKLLKVCPNLSINLAFKVADELLMRAIKGITEIITKPGLVNLDFNDIKTIMKGAGVALIGLGESEEDSDDRATEAIEDALNSPLLEVDISDATGVLINVVGGTNMTLMEAEKVASTIQSRVSPNARIIWGAAVDPTLSNKMRVMLIITGVKSEQIFDKKPVDEEYLDGIPTVR